MAYNDRGGSRFGGGGGGYRGGGRKFGGGGYGGGHGGGGRGGFRGEREMHQATCSDCGKSCEVPFKPSGDKPVLCRDCFRGKDNDAGGGRPGGRDFGGDDSRGSRRSYGDRDFSDRPPMEMHGAVCSDCGKDCEVPFKPSGDKPIFCDKCFGRNKEIKTARPAGGNSSKMDERLNMINIKLDRILKALDAKASMGGNGPTDEKSGSQKKTKAHDGKAEEPAASKDAKSTAGKFANEDKMPAKKSPVIRGMAIVKKEGKAAKDSSGSDSEKSVIKKMKNKKPKVNKAKEE